MHQIEIAKGRLEQLGFKVTFGKNVMNSINDDFGCATISDKVEDLHEAFKDKKVKAMLTVICGFSDITALLNAIYTKTGLVTYYGPHFSSFGMKYGFDYTMKYFKDMLMDRKEAFIENSEQWSDDSWYKEQENREFINHDGMKIIKSGKEEGKIIGGNLCTLNLLQGTEYMPDATNSILFLEDDDLVGNEFIREFDRDLQSLLHHLKGKKLKGLVIGRAEKKSNMNEQKWKEIIETKRELMDIPVMINANFGHTTPIFTFPIGGYTTIDTTEVVKIKIKN